MDSTLAHIFSTIKNERNGVANIHKAFSDFPIGIGAHYSFYKEIILADDLPLSREDREYLAVKTSEANTCPYCIEHHKEALTKYPTHSRTDKKSRALGQLAELLTKEPWKSAQLKEEFISVGFSESEWQHSVMVVSYFNFVNRCAHAMNIGLEEDFKKTCN